METLVQWFKHKKNALMVPCLNCAQNECLFPFIAVFSNDGDSKGGREGSRIQDFTTAMEPNSAHHPKNNLLL